MGLLANIRTAFLGAPTPADLALAEGAARHRAELALSFGGTNLSSVDPRVAGVAARRSGVLQITDRLGGELGLDHATRLLVLHAMRTYYPTLAAAIYLRRVLEGEVYPVSDDEGLQTALRERWEQVPVGYVEGAGTLRGGNTYLNTLASGADEYGLAVGEIVTDPAGRTVERLVVPNTRTLSHRRIPGTSGAATRYELVQTDARGQEPLRGPLIQSLAFRPAHEGPWPEALASSIVQTSEVVLRMIESVNSGWWRFGDPSMLLGIEYGADVAVETTAVASGGERVEVPTDLLLMKNTVEAVMTARRSGRVGDAYVASQGKLRNEVLGQVDATLMRYFTEQASTFDGWLVPLTDVPVWLFPTVERSGDGLGGALSQNQASIAATGAHQRNRRKVALGKAALDTVLLTEGEARHASRYEMEATEVNVLDEKLIAETRKAAADAVATEIENAAQLFDEEGGRRFAGDAERYLEDRDIL